MWYVTEERELMRKVAQEFSEKEVRPFVPDMENNKFPKYLLKRMAELGFNGVGFPEEVGGIGRDWVTAGMIVEEIAKVSNTAAFLHFLNAYLFPDTIFNLGSPEQKAKWLTPSIAGEIFLALSSTEPTGFLNWTEYQTRAVLDGDNWVINGAKIFTTIAGQADYYLVNCITSTPNPATFEGASLIVVPKDAVGFEVGHIEHKLGWHGSSTGQVYFRNCRVPKDNLLGPQDKSMQVMTGIMPVEFAMFGASCLGSSLGVFQKTLKYTRERLQLGKSLFATHQSVRETLTNMWIDIEVFRGAVYQTLEMMNKGMNVMAHACAVKVRGAQLFESVSSKCIELHGGNGVVFENDVERYYRDAKMNHIGGGATPIVVDLLSTFI